ncbi:MAG: DNA polymerase [Candidatus Parcubacteria bacterium]|nr:MAG: DNA polymerase [Candidatus Parcubacteria bacterium]
MEKIVILDTNSLIYRFYYALPLFSSHNGIPTNALYGLTNAVLKIINEENPDYFIACFDSKTKTFRHKKDFLYKAQRPKIADELKIQINLAPKILKSFNIDVIEKENYEADDLIGSLIKKYNNKLKIIYSGDLDLLQILDENTILKFFKRGVSEIEIYTKKTVLEKFQLQPNQLADFKALIGDVSDNILGIKGIGKKTATDLLLRFDNIEQIIYAAEKKIIPLPLRDLIIKNKERLILNKELATIITDLNLDFNLKKYKNFDLEKTFEILKEFDFYSIIKRLKGNQFQKNIDDIIFEQEIPLFLNEVFCLINNDQIYIFDNEKYYLTNLSSIKKVIQAKRIIVYDLKLFFKVFLKFNINFSDLDINNFFDIKIAFWLTKNIVKPDVDKILNFYFKDIISENNKINLFFKFMPKIYKDLIDEIYKNDLYNALIVDQKISFILALMENYGLAIDRERLVGLKLSIQNELSSLKKEIYDLAGTIFNLNSNNDLRRIIFENLKLPIKNIRKTPKGELSVKESELIKLIDYHPIIKKILEYKEKSKILSNFIKNIIKYSQDNKIATNFEITGTATGRIISTSPNLQNIPLNLKDIFVPHYRDSILVSYDYSQIELRILAHLSGDENLLNIFYKNLDIHSITAKLLFKEENEKTRRLAKIINYGIIYGITPIGISQRTGLSLSTSKELINNYFNNFPGVKKFLDDLINKFNSYGYAETFLNRKRFFTDVNTPKALRIAINTPIQGTAADILKLSILDIFNYLNSKNLLNDVKFLLIVHDEIIFEINKLIVNDVKFKIKNIMENVANFKVPLVVKIKEGFNLKDLK